MRDGRQYGDTNYRNINRRCVGVQWRLWLETFHVGFMTPNVSDSDSSASHMKTERIVLHLSPVRLKQCNVFQHEFKELYMFSHVIDFNGDCLQFQQHLALCEFASIRTMAHMSSPTLAGAPLFNVKIRYHDMPMTYALIFCSVISMVGTLHIANEKKIGWE